MADKSESSTDAWGSCEPYVQLVRSLLPRAISVALFDAQGRMRWSSETTTGPDLHALIERALESVGSNPQCAGQMLRLDGGQPVYLCWLRDDAEALIGVVGVICRASGE